LANVPIQTIDVINGLPVITWNFDSDLRKRRRRIQKLNITRFAVYKMYRRFSFSINLCMCGY
jgi:hypothetical protein